MTSKRDKKVQIRLSEDEKNQLLENAQGLELSTYLRQVGLKQKAEAPKPVTKRVIHTADPDLVREVTRIGININQMARHLNITQEVDRAIFLELLKIKDDLNEVLEQVVKNDT